MTYDELRPRLAQSPFRSRFKLRDRDREYIASRGWDVIAQQARDILQVRLAPDVIPNDGRQTPMRGHPVFLAQHATASCCRGCLAKWHHLPTGRALTHDELEQTVAIIVAWLQEQAGDLSRFPYTPLLFPDGGAPQP